MPRLQSVLAGICFGWAMALFMVPFNGPTLLGQENKGALPTAAVGDQVVVKREATRIIDPHRYRVSLTTQPLQTVTLTAPFDGVVKQAAGKPNSKVGAQTEVIRLDTTVAKFRVARAEALVRVATQEQKLEADKDETHKALAQAKLDVAKAELEAEKFTLEQCSVRAPFAGELQRLLVGEGQFVRTGDPLAIVVDVSKIQVEVPVERATTEVGKMLSVKIESTELDAKVDSVLPLSSKFDVLRDLFDSIASANVLVDNPDGKLKIGQTVYVALTPRQPLAEVPSGAIGNGADGQRKVQVVRQFIVRDVPVTLMAGVGPKRLYVSGPFVDGDEVIYESSHQLQDSFQLKPSSGATVTAGPGGNQANPNTTTAPPKKDNAGF